ncbi:hypothetical protein [Spirosoma sp. KNUC1025]
MFLVDKSFDADSISCMFGNEGLDEAVQQGGSPIYRSTAQVIL